MRGDALVFPGRSLRGRHSGLSLGKATQVSEGRQPGLPWEKSLRSVSLKEDSQSFH